ncbi:ATG13 domain-containing protein [Psidium guajava]|nr:ATG13 domain-containing protein [Psidium guajava]
MSKKRVTPEAVVEAAALAAKGASFRGGSLPSSEYPWILCEVFHGESGDADPVVFCNAVQDGLRNRGLFTDLRKDLGLGTGKTQKIFFVFFLVGLSQKERERERVSSEQIVGWEGENRTQRTNLSPREDAEAEEGRERTNGVHGDGRFSRFWEYDESGPLLPRGAV